SGGHLMAATSGGALTLTGNGADLKGNSALAVTSGHILNLAGSTSKATITGNMVLLRGTSGLTLGALSGTVTTAHGLNVSAGAAAAPVTITGNMADQQRACGERHRRHRDSQRQCGGSPSGDGREYEWNQYRDGEQRTSRECDQRQRIGDRQRGPPQQREYSDVGGDERDGDDGAWAERERGRGGSTRD